MEKVKPIVIEKTQFGFTDTSKLSSFQAFLDYQDYDGRIKLHMFSIKKSFSLREVLLEPLMQEVKVLVIEKYFENLDIIIANIFGNFSRSRIGSKGKTYAIRASAMLAVRDSQKTETVPSSFK